MADTTHIDVSELESMKLPELQARFEDVVGEPTRAPNRTYLIRRITEALEAQQAKGDGPDGPEAAPDATQTPPQTKVPVDQQRPPAGNEGAVAGDGDSADVQPRPLSKLTVPELQALYVDVVQRPSGSSNAAYLRWKIREVQKGRIKAGPVQRRKTDGGNFKVLPLRLEAGTVEKLDEAVERLGFTSRMAFMREAIGTLLAERGEDDVARYFVEVDGDAAATGG